MSNTKKSIYYALLFIVSVLFVFSGYSKIISVPEAVQNFTNAHLPLWLLYLIGPIEILGAIGLWIPMLQRLAVYALLTVLAGAILTSAIFVSITATIFPLAIAVALIYILRVRNKNMAMPIL